MADPSDVEDFKLWPTPVEEHFIDVLVEEEAKGNMPSGQFKKNLWTVVMGLFSYIGLGCLLRYWAQIFLSKGVETGSTATQFGLACA